MIEHGRQDGAVLVGGNLTATPALGGVTLPDCIQDKPHIVGVSTYLVQYFAGADSNYFITSGSFFSEVGYCITGKCNTTTC
jgi:hypothetical protein